MSRSPSAILTAALVSVLWTGIAPATTLPGLPATDAASQVFSRVFGETSDRGASFTAAMGDRSAESPLRNLALGGPVANAVTPASEAVSLPLLASRVFRSSEFLRPPLTLSDAAVRAPQIGGALSAGSEVHLSSQVPVVGFYEGAQPAPTGGPASYQFDFSSRSNAGGPLLGFSSSAAPALATVPAAGGPNPSLGLTGTGGSVAVPFKVGRVRFQTHAEAQQLSAANALGAGATFDVRAGSRNLGLDLSSRFEHMTLSQPVFGGSNFDSGGSIGVSGENIPLFVPAYAGVNTTTYSAGVAVPVIRGLTASVRYDTQHLLGGYSAYGASGLDARNDVYGASVTYQLPKSASAISLSAKQYHYQDNIIPQNAFTQTNANVDFTVKF